YALQQRERKQAAGDQAARERHGLPPRPRRGDDGQSAPFAQVRLSASELLAEEHIFGAGSNRVSTAARWAKAQNATVAANAALSVCSNYFFGLVVGLAVTTQRGGPCAGVE